MYGNSSARLGRYLFRGSFSGSQYRLMVVGSTSLAVPARHKHHTIRLHSWSKQKKPPATRQDMGSATMSFVDSCYEHSINTHSAISTKISNTPLMDGMTAAQVPVLAQTTAH